MPNTSVIIVNWNGEGFLRECFQSLKAQSYTDFEVVFVDNASSDNSVALVRELIPELGLKVKIVELPTNTGFTGGNIEGLRHSEGRYIALLNNDTTVSEKWLEALVRAMEAHPEVGICASKLIVAGADVIDSAGDGLSTNLRAYKRGEGFKASLFMDEEYVFGACAGAALYRREMLDEVGFFDDDFFLIFEDADLNFRAQLAGWKCLFVPDAVVLHKVSPSLGKIGDLKTFYSVRNGKIMILKNTPIILMFKYLPLHIFEEIVFSFEHHIKAGTFKSYMRAYCEFLRSIPRCLAKRKRIMKLRKVPSNYIESMLKKTFPIYKDLFMNKIRMTFKRQSGP